MKTWKKFKEDNNLNEAETISWKSLSKSARIELLRDVRLPDSFAKESWKQLDFRAKERLGKHLHKTTAGEFRLDEGRDTYYEFPNDRLAKQFAKDIANAGVATGTVSGNRVIDVEFLKSSSAGLSVKALKKYLKQNRGKGPMVYKESVVQEEARAFDNKNEAKKMAYKLAKKTGEGYTVLEVFHDAGSQGKLFQVVSDTASDEWNRKMNTRTVLRTAYNESVELDEAESIHWNKMKKDERVSLLKDSGLPSSFAKDDWKGLDHRAKERMGKYVNKSTKGEYALRP